MPAAVGLSNFDDVCSLKVCASTWRRSAGRETETETGMQERYKTGEKERADRTHWEEQEDQVTAVIVCVRKIAYDTDQCTHSKLGSTELKGAAARIVSSVRRSRWHPKVWVRFT